MPGVLAALDAAGYEGFVSVKVYRRTGWEAAARGAAASLRACDARLG